MNNLEIADELQRQEFNRLNGESINMILQLPESSPEETWKKEAIDFFGEHLEKKDKKIIKKKLVQFKKEYKSFKNNKLLKIVMKENGGMGKHYTVPPLNFIPEDHCEKCLTNKMPEDELNKHLQIHKSSAFLEYCKKGVLNHTLYTEWSNKDTQIEGITLDEHVS